MVLMIRSEEKQKQREERGRETWREGQGKGKGKGKGKGREKGKEGKRFLVIDQCMDLCEMLERSWRARRERGREEETENKRGGVERTRIKDAR